MPIKISGVSVAVDDNICVAGMPATCSSKMLAGFCPAYDATVIAKLKENGAVIKCKTNIDEFGIGTHSGAAKAVIDGLVDFGIASDSSGSVRLSAASYSLIGYKPTYGAVSRYGLISCAGSFEQIGVIARTISDAAVIASVISGHDVLDATSNPEFASDFSDIENFNIKGKKIGVMGNIGDKIYNAVKSLGFGLANISLPNIKHSVPVYEIMAAAEASSNLARYDGVRFGHRAAEYDDIESLYINSRTEGFGVKVKQAIILGAYVLSSQNYEKYYKKARFAQSMIRNDFKEAFKGCDVILAPVSGTADTVPANIAGLPAVSVPVSSSASIQLIGNKFDDASLLGFARVFERELNGGAS